MARRGRSRHRDGTPGAAAATPRESVAWQGLSLLQPLATLATCGRVDRLRMAWGTSYRGPLLIHSANVWDVDVRRVCNSRPWRDALTGLGYGKANPLPVGGFIGAIRVDDCILINEYEDDEESEIVGGSSGWKEITEGDMGWTAGWNFFHGKRWKLRYDWMIKDPFSLARPVRSKGTKDLPIPNIAIFPVPIEVGAEVKVRSNPVRVDPIEWPEAMGTMIDIASSYHKELNYAD